MKRLLAPNLDRKGRLVRGMLGLALLAGAVVSLAYSMWLGGLLIAAGLLALFEAARGWCLARACGIKTRL